MRQLMAMRGGETCGKLSPPPPDVPLEMLHPSGVSCFLDAQLNKFPL